MSSDSESSSDDDTFYFWNNWKPPIKKRHRCENLSGTLVKTVNCNTWLPPVTFRAKRSVKVKDVNEIVENVNQEIVVKESIDLYEEWGVRMIYGQSYSDVAENEFTWNIFPPGAFGYFKLERNDSGQLIAFAEAEWDNGNKFDKNVIQIDNELHLRKLLGVAADEWNALIEALGSCKFILIYEALRKRPIRQTIAEKLWYFLCKRRHYLPNVALKIRKNGAKKMPRLFNIFPKFRVEQIRTFDGKEF